MRIGLDDLVYDVVKYATLILITIACVLPFIHVVGVSLMPQADAIRSTAILWPKKIDLRAYNVIFGTKNIMLGLRNSALITILGTATSLLVTSTFAYGLSKPRMPGARFFSGTLVFTMLFNGGIIPLYLTVKALGLMDTFASVILVAAMQPFWTILMRNFFEQLPAELFESAELEGASEWTIYWRIALPLSKAAMAAFTLFYAVNFWNEFFHALMFISKPAMWPIQVWLREMIVNASQVGLSQAGVDMDQRMQAPATMQMAVVVVSTLPILFVYPFLQKHFTKGVMLGSVKG
jgi:putative aldouronate transport system permease protein